MTEIFPLILMFTIFSYYERHRQIQNANILDNVTSFSEIRDIIFS